MLATPQQLRELLDYDPETGVLTWKPRPREMFRQSGHCGRWNACFSGMPAGSRTKSGYLRIEILGRSHYAHRVAWAIHFGEWPQGQIDHENGRRDDNRTENMRDVTNAENHRNKKTPRTNTSGVIGVFWENQRKKWHAQVEVAGRLIHLGYFHSLDAAAAARKDAEQRFGFHENHGRRKSS